MPFFLVFPIVPRLIRIFIIYHSFENSVLTYKKVCGIIISLPIRAAPDGRLKKVAGVAKLADALDLGSSAVRREGSSPFVRTIQSCGSSSFGRAPPCQGGGGGFEPRLPLHFNPYGRKAMRV